MYLISMSSEMTAPSLSFEHSPDEGPKTLSPEQRLIAAVLRRAVWDFAYYRDSEPGTDRYEIAADAAGWVFYEGHEHMSFHYACEVLSIDPEEVRKSMLKMRRSDVEKLSARLEG